MSPRRSSKEDAAERAGCGRPTSTGIARALREELRPRRSRVNGTSKKRPGTVAQRSPPNLSPRAAPGFAPAGGVATSAGFLGELIEPTGGFPVPSEQLGTTTVTRVRAEPVKRIVRKRLGCERLMGFGLRRFRGDVSRCRSRAKDRTTLDRLFRRCFDPARPQRAKNPGHQSPRNMSPCGVMREIRETRMFHQISTVKLK